MYCVVAHVIFYSIYKKQQEFPELQIKKKTKIEKNAVENSKFVNQEGQLNSSVYDPVVANFVHNIEQRPDGCDIVLRDVVRTELFPRVKFIINERDLLYSMDKNSICYSICKWCNCLHDNEAKKVNFWMKNTKKVKKYLTQHRNNVIKNIKKIAKSKYKI